MSGTTEWTNNFDSELSNMSLNISGNQCLLDLKNWKEEFSCFNDHNESKREKDNFS